MLILHALRVSFDQVYRTVNMNEICIRCDWTACTSASASCEVLCRIESPAWLAAASYNVALAAVLAQDLTAVSNLFRASGSLHEAFSTPTAQYRATQMPCTLAPSAYVNPEWSAQGRTRCMVCSSLLQCSASSRACKGLYSSTCALQAQRQHPWGLLSTRS